MAGVVSNFPARNPTDWFGTETTDGWLLEFGKNMLNNGGKCICVTLESGYIFNYDYSIWYGFI